MKSHRHRNRTESFGKNVISPRVVGKEGIIYSRTKRTIFKPVAGFSRRRRRLLSQHDRGWGTAPVHRVANHVPRRQLRLLVRGARDCRPAVRPVRVADGDDHQ